MDAEMIERLKKGFEMVETHISWVLLGEHVYKIKKPVKFSFLDFSTLEKRRFFCEEEVRLNKRLSPDIYLGVVPVIEDGERISLGGEGTAIGYAVKMKRLPSEARMDRNMDNVSKETVAKIAAMISEFHGEIDIIRDKGYSSADVVKRQIDDLAEFRDIIEEACGLGKDVDFAVGRCDEFIEKNQGLFEKRQDDGMIRDCHGDLHSANIFITDRIVIFDCIEFSKDFRFIDTASEIAFMAMDLDAFGRKDLSGHFVEEYLAGTGDQELRRMLPVYKCYRANVRAKIAAIDYSQHPGEEPRERMRKYVGLAREYAEGLDGS